MRLQGELASLVALASNALGAHSVCLFLKSKARRAFQLAAYHSLSRHIREGVTLLPGQGLVGWVLESGEPLHVQQFDKDAAVLGYYARPEDIKSFMAAPLPSERTGGALAADSKRSWCFTPKSQKLLQGFAQQFAHVVDRALEFASRDHRRVEVAPLADYLGRLAGSRSLDELVSQLCLPPQGLLPFDGCFVALRPPQGPARVVRTSGFDELFLEGEPVAEHRSVAGWVIRHGETLRLPDLRAERRHRALFHPEEPPFAARSALVVPLTPWGETRGAFGLISLYRGGFDAHGARLAELVARQAGQCLERLFPLAGRGGEGGRSARLLLEKLLDELLGRGERVALVLLALEGFEGLRARLGERGLSELLASCESLLRKFGGEQPVAAHLGEGHFALALPGLEEEHAEAVALRVGECFEETLFLPQGQEVRPRVDLGLACAPQQGRRAEELLEAARGALEGERPRGLSRMSFAGEGAGR
ncbi:MAG: GAF domain-containing protein [Nitrospinota bacterium]